jgi:hypothetical protein
MVIDFIELLDRKESLLKSGAHACQSKNGEQFIFQESAEMLEKTENK